MILAERQARIEAQAEALAAKAAASSTEVTIAHLKLMIEKLYDPARPGGPVTSAFCWSHARRGFFELANIAASARRGPGAAPVSPIALEAVKRIDALFAIEREINGLSADERR